MTTIQSVKIKRQEDSLWEKAIELIIDHFDSVQRIYDVWGFEIDEYYDIKYYDNDLPINIPLFP